MEPQKYCILCHDNPIIATTVDYVGSSDRDGVPQNSQLSLSSVTSTHKIIGDLEGRGNEDIQLINSFYSGIQISGFAPGDLSNFVYGDGDTDDHGQLSICGECKLFLETALKRKMDLDNAEANVRQLQLQLLRKLNEVKLLVHQFYDVMKEVEEKIGQGNQSQWPWNSCQVEMFEKRIRQVVKDLSSCQLDQIQIQEDTCQNEMVSSNPELVLKSSSPPYSLQESKSDYDDPNSGDSCTNQSYKDASESDDGSDSDYDNRTNKLKRSKITTPTKSSTFKKLEPDPHYSPCKTDVINKVLLRKELILSGKPLPRKPGEKTDVKDPRDAYYIDYDHITDSFSLDGVSITLNVTSQNEKAFNFNCSQCLFVTGQRQWKDNKISPFLEILDHVLRLHRQIFQCSYCARNCSSLTIYREHMRGHQLKYVCDICGKPLQTRKNLEMHKWTHMNEEEREQAVKEGKMKDPRLLRNQLKGDIFQCSTCGKEFNRKGNLKLHERTHLDKEEKRRICDKCGKSCISYSSWNQHKRICMAGEDPSVERSIQCTKCTNTFKNVKGLKTHLRRNHPENGREKGLRCDICGKGFWTLGELKKHLITHGDDRPFECGKGCGMRFKCRGTWRHHQKCCDGSGTRPGPKNGKRRGGKKN